MSAIGDYIHLTKQGYNNHGTTQSGAYLKWDSQALWREKQYKNLKVREQTLNEYEALVKELTKKHQSSIDMATVQQDILNYTTEEFDNKFKEANLDTVTVEIPEDDFKGYVGRIKLRTTKNAGQAQYTITTTMKTLIHKIEVLEQKLNLENSTLTEAEIEKLKDKIKNIKELYIKAFNIVDKGLQENIRAGKFSNEVKNQLSSISTTTTNTSIIQLRAELNDAIEKYAAYPAIALYEGTLWENILGAVGYCANTTAYSSVADAISKTVQGDRNITADFNNSAFAKFLQQKIQLDKNTILNLTNHQENYRSKIDVQLQWRTGDTLRISAKNITVRDNKAMASLVDGSPLTTMVQNMDTNFVNHYLNLTSIQGLKSSSLANEARAEMKKNLALTALAGLHIPGKENHVNVFAVNDKLGTGIKFITVYNLAKRMENLASSVSVQYNGISMMKHSFQKNRKINGNNGAHIRILKLVQEMHTLKVHAAINISNLIYS